MRLAERNPSRALRFLVATLPPGEFLSWPSVQVSVARANRPLAQVKPHNGRPTLFINGRPHTDFCTMTYRPPTLGL